MSDAEDVFRVLEEEEPMPRPPKLRVYLRSDASLPIHSVSGYRELFRQEIANTVADPADVESELRYLAAVLTTK
jgi:hypothetical protein